VFSCFPLFSIQADAATRRGLTQALGAMNRFVLHVSFLLLAALSGIAWALVYPFYGVVTDAIILVVGAIFFAAFQLTHGSIRWTFVLVAVASAVGGPVALVWPDASWRHGFWFPSLPPFLHWLFQTDGEASYNADGGQLFLVLFLVLLALLLAFPRLRQSSDVISSKNKRIIEDRPRFPNVMTRRSFRVRPWRGYRWRPSLRSTFLTTRRSCPGFV
jgi:hypothetical protein